MKILALLVFSSLAFDYAFGVNCKICDKNGCKNQECDTCKVHLNDLHVECKQAGHCHSDDHHKCCDHDACMSAIFNVSMISCPVCDGHSCHYQQCISCQFDTNDQHSHCKGDDCHGDGHKVCCRTDECVQKYHTHHRTTTHLPVVTTTQTTHASNMITTETSTSVPQTTTESSINTTSGNSVFCSNCENARTSGCIANSTRCHDKSCLIRHDMKTDDILVSCMDTKICNVLSKLDNGSTVCCLEDSCFLNIIKTMFGANSTVTSEVTTMMSTITSDETTTFDTTTKTSTTPSDATFDTTTKSSTTTSSLSSTTDSLCHDEDDGYLNCQSLNNLYGFCNTDPTVYSDAYFYAYTKCKRTCGHCNDTFHPSTTKLPTTAADRATTTCFQCGDIASGLPCDTRYVYSGAPTDCPPNKHFCQTDLVYDGTGNIQIYKRCVDEVTCKTEWLDQTSDLDACVDASTMPVLGHYVCHYCCVGDACNSNVIPANYSLYA